MARNNQVDTRIDPGEDIEQRTRNAAAAFVVEADLGVESLMDRDHRGIDAFGLECFDRAIDRVGFVAETQARHPAGRHQRWSVLQRQPDDPDRQFACGRIEAFDRVGREQRAAIGHHHIGGQECEVRAAEIGFDRTGFAQAVLLAAAFLDAFKLAPATVEFMVANGVEIEP